MARPKKNAEDKKQAQQVPQVAPQPPQQPMMPQGTAPQAMAYQGMAPQMAMPQMPQQQQMPRQAQHQFQQFAPQVQMPQQPPPQMPQQQIQMPQQNVSGRLVDADAFISVRDSTLTRLATITELLRSLTSDYLRHTSLLLGDTSEANQVDLLANFESAAAQAAQAMHLNTDAPAPVAPVEEKKERKKRTHDPNAPKRPLTPYFLYMQHARGIISTDLGTDAPKGAVQEEGQRRWASMGGEEKKGWNQAYQYNLRLYNARTASYKAGNLDAKNMTDDDALAYANANGMPEVPQNDGDVNAALLLGDPNDNDAIAQQLQGAIPVATPASKTPKKAAGGRKRKSEAADDSKAATPAAATPAAASPAKRRRSTKAAAADTPAAEETKPKGRGGKKTKSS